MGLRVAIAVVVFFSLSSASTVTKPATVWLDVDPATGLPESEVDDGLAMVQAFHSPELVIRGVGVVFGNTTLGNACPIARDVAARFGPEGLGVHCGAASSAERGRSTEAVRALAEALRQSPMTILALGPLTNVASLLELHPELHERVESVVIVAGRRPGQRFVSPGLSHTPHPDFNFEQDPESVRVLLESTVPLVLAPWEVSSHVWIRAADLEALAGSGPSGRWIAEACQSWLELWGRELGADGFNPFDTLAVGWVTHPECMDSTEMGVWIEERDDDRAAAGSRRSKLYLLADPDRPAARRALYLSRPLPRFKTLPQRNALIRMKPTRSGPSN